MARRLLTALAIGAAGFSVGCSLSVPAIASAAVPTTSPILDGAAGRTVLDGWQFRADQLGVGEASGWSNGGDGSGWVPVAVPYALNSTSLTDVDFMGSIGWFRTEFDSSTSVGVITLQGIGGAVKVWSNGRLVAARSAIYGVPVEVELGGLHAKGNLLVVKVDSHPWTDSLPTMLSDGSPHAGWWNWGGLLREVDFRPAGDADLRNVAVTSRLACLARTCPFAVSVTAEVVNTTDHPLVASVSGTLDDADVSLGSSPVPAHASVTLKTTRTVARDRSWSPADPRLSLVTLQSSAVQATGSGWRLKTGFRDIRVKGGKLLLNGSPIRLWGVALHEESKSHGAAMTTADLEQLWNRVRASHANVIRSHYPLAPQLLEWADRDGVLVWDEIPLWQEDAELLASTIVRTRSGQAVEGMIRRDSSHPSVVAWSLGNELPDAPAAAAWVAEGAQKARSLDPSRPVALAVLFNTAQSHAWDAVDLLGVNLYIGWYGSGGSPSSDGWLIDNLRRARPKQAMLATEFGAEATPAAPSAARGGEVFQKNYLMTALRSLSRTNGSGGIVFVLRDFACRPDWLGGNDPAYANPPFNGKGLLRRDDTRKASWAPVTSLLARLTGKT